MASSSPKNRGRSGKKSSPVPKRGVFGKILLVLSGLSLVAGFALAAVFLHLNGTSTPRVKGLSPRKGWETQLPLSIERISKKLAELPINLPPASEQRRGMGGAHWTLRHYEIEISEPTSGDDFERWFKSIEQLAPEISTTVAQSAAGAEVQIGVDGVLTHTLTFRWIGHRPHLSIVLMQLGDDLLEAREAIALGMHVTLAIDPRRPFAREVGELANLAHLEILLEWPTRSSGEGDDGGLQILGDALAAFPKAAGVVMTTPLSLQPTPDGAAFWAAAQARKLFFIDASSDANPTTCEIVRANHLDCFARDVQIDLLDDPESVRVQLESAITLVRTRGNVVAVGRAHPTALAALHFQEPNLRRARIEVVPMSSIVADRLSLSVQ